jgi:hypothetical protein
MISKSNIENIYNGVLPITSANVTLDPDNRALIKIFDNEIEINKSEIQRYYYSNYPLINSGINVWKKLGFSYKFAFSEDSIVAKWKEYVSSELGYQGKDFFDIIKGISAISQIQRKYLRPNGKKSFTDWLNDLDELQEVPMYKNIA